MVKAGKARFPYAGYYSLDGNAWSSVGLTCSQIRSRDYLAGLAVSSRNETSLNTAKFESLAFSESTEAEAIAQSAPANWSESIPSGFTASDIGSPALPGWALFRPGANANASGTWTLAAGDGDIFWGEDRCHFIRRPVEGDQVLTAKVIGVSKTGLWKKAGLMFRDGAEPSSMFVDLVLNGANDLSTQWRGPDGKCDFVSIEGVGDIDENHPLWLRLTKRGATFTSYFSRDGNTWRLAGGASVLFKNKSYLGGLAASSNNDGVFNISTFTNVTFAAPAKSLNPPADSPGFDHADIGAPWRHGTAFHDPVEGLWTVSGAGEDMWGPRDQFHYAYTTVQRDQVLIAKVSGMTSTRDYAKAGVMFRDSSADDSRFAAACATPEQGVEMEWRDTAGECHSLHAGDCTPISELHPVWVKLLKKGDSVTGFCSWDGAVWEQIGAANLPFKNPACLAGLAVCGRYWDALNTASFCNISLRTPTPQDLRDPDNALINLARDAKVTASSEQDGHPARDAVDGVPSTFWAAAKEGASEWLYIDLGTVRKLSGASLFWEHEELACPYKLEIGAEGAPWTLVAENRDGRRDQAMHSFNVSGRYVRFTCLGGKACIGELQVLGKQAGNAK